MSLAASEGSSARASGYPASGEAIGAVGSGGADAAEAGGWAGAADGELEAEGCVVPEASAELEAGVVCPDADIEAAISTASKVSPQMSFIAPTPVPP